MDPNILQPFLRQALQQIPSIRRSLTTAANGPCADVDSICAQLLEMSAAAQNLEQMEIAEFAAAIEFEISEGSGAGSGLSLLSKLEASILRTMLEDKSFSLDLDESEVTFAQTEEDPISFMFDTPLTAEPPTPDFSEMVFTAEDPVEYEPQTFTSDSADEFEVDHELLDIFAEEAEELLRNIDNSLNNLSNDRNDSDSLWEIRRNAHTFKGSAGIVGLKQLSEVAHRVEDLLDRLAEIKCGANDQIIELLHRSTACLKSLVAGQRSDEFFRTISQLYYDFDLLLNSLNQPAPMTRVEAVEMPLMPEAVYAEQAPETVEAVGASIPLDKMVLARLLGAEVAESFVPRPAASRSVVRVSLDRLDDLVRITRDMLIGRSVFEQNLKSLERQIDDLHNATRRLQTTSTKLEIDFEASMMGSGSSFIQSGSVGNPIGHGSFDELEFDKYTDFHQSTRELAETTSDTFSINASLDLLRGGFESVVDEQRRLIDELQRWLLHVRMVEFGSLSSRLQRAVRVTCDEEHKKAELRIVNESVEVDTQILDSLVEPLMHLLKNSVAHGIEDTETRRLMGKPESGSISIAVENDETHIVLRISDDGRGISPEAVKDKAVALGKLTEVQAAELSDEEALELIFLPGLSTAEKLNLSAGRGVGMSIVKESIVAGRGSVTIESTSLKGTTFLVRMPLALAVTKVLLTRVAGCTYALPLRPITHIAELTDDVFAGIDGKKVDILGKKLPLYQLPTFLGKDALEPAELLGRSALVYESSGRSCAIAVEELLTTEEVVIKPLAKPLDKINGILGAAILGNGDLVPIIDMHSLLRKNTHHQPTAVPPRPREKSISVMIVDDSPSVRHMTSKVVKSAGWEPKTAKDGLEALEQLKACDELPAIILSDIEMPRMDGYEFAASLKRSEKFNHIPVIMITSRTTEKHREKALESGVSQYLTKPYEDRELIDSIKILANLT
ncbi:MAG: response regulator [bacterium]|nr:response regulator [bacterium]